MLLPLFNGVNVSVPLCSDAHATMGWWCNGEVFWRRLDLEARALMNGMCVLIYMGLQRAFLPSFLPFEGTRSQPFTTRKRSSPESDHEPWPQTLSLQNHSVVYQSPSLWYFVIASQTDNVTGGLLWPCIFSVPYH
jgi:hypothetical protein